MNTIFEKTGGTFTKQGDYLLPNLTITNEENTEIGVWGQQMNNIRARATEIVNTEVVFV